MTVEEKVQSLQDYKERPPTPAGLSAYLGLNLLQFEVALKRDDALGEAIRYMLTEMCAFYQARISKSNLEMIAHIYHCFGLSFGERK